MTAEQTANIKQLAFMNEIVDFVADQSTQSKLSVKQVADCIADMAERRKRKTAIQHATDAFWQSIADSYPNITTGECKPLQVVEFDRAAMIIVKHWLQANSQTDTDTDKQTD